MKDITGGRELVMVSNRLPVDSVEAEDGSKKWRTSPGGLVTAVEPIVEQLGCVWVGWEGSTNESTEPFDVGNMRLQPVELSDTEVQFYYEGFSNATLWPLYHDVITAPEYHRLWWDSYVSVNQRFANKVASVASEGAIIWVHDYQLQLVPAMLRCLRPDVIIGFFLHIPFPPRGIFAQLPWRREIVEGLLGADVIAFQRATDANSFRTAAQTLNNCPVAGNTITVTDVPGGTTRNVLCQEFPISIDAAALSSFAASPEVQVRAAQIRDELGEPDVVMLGVDRLDYTKGLLHRIKAYGELLDDRELDSTKAVLVQVASPSRERVDAYKKLRDEIEVAVGRINGEHGTTAHTPLVYLHRSYDRAEMAALYTAADVMLVTPLRDGMNLVAKEYVACRADENGALVLSEFAGAAEELREAVLVNPHDIEGMKTAIVRAVNMPVSEQRRRMRALRNTVKTSDVSHWANNFLGAVRAATKVQTSRTHTPQPSSAGGVAPYPPALEEQLRQLAGAPQLLIATDFDGTLAPLVSRPEDASILTTARRALDILHHSPGVKIAVLTGRSLASLDETGLWSEDWVVSGSHGLELNGTAIRYLGETSRESALTEQERQQLELYTRRAQRLFKGEKGVKLEFKPYGVAVHTRGVAESRHAEDLLTAASELGRRAGLPGRLGKQVCEVSVRQSDKGVVLKELIGAWPDAAVLFMGDDVTDEDAFSVLRHGDVGIKVGKGETLAKARIADPQAAAYLLALLAELRTGVAVGAELTGMPFSQQ